MNRTVHFFKNKKNTSRGEKPALREKRFVRASSSIPLRSDTGRSRVPGGCFYALEYVCVGPDKLRPWGVKSIWPGPTARRSCLRTGRCLRSRFCTATSNFTQRCALASPPLHCPLTPLTYPWIPDRAHHGPKLVGTGCGTGTFFLLCTRTDLHTARIGYVMMRQLSFVPVAPLQAGGPVWRCIWGSARICLSGSASHSSRRLLAFPPLPPVSGLTPSPPAPPPFPCPPCFTFLFFALFSTTTCSTPRPAKMIP